MSERVKFPRFDTHGSYQILIQIKTKTKKFLYFWICRWMAIDRHSSVWSTVPTGVKCWWLHNASCVCFPCTLKAPPWPKQWRVPPYYRTTPILTRGRGWMLQSSSFCSRGTSERASTIWPTVCFQPYRKCWPNVLSRLLCNKSLLHSTSCDRLSME